MKRGILLFAILVLGTAAFMYLNRMFMGTYDVIFEKVVTLHPAKQDATYLTLKRNYSGKFGYMLADRRLPGHPGYPTPEGNYVFRRFGFCSFSECLVFSNDFSPNEFYIHYYSNSLWPFGDRKAVTKVIDMAVQHQPKVPETSRAQ